MPSTSFNWFKRLLVLGSVAAVAAMLAAGASGAVTPSAAPDVFERYAAAHPYGSTPVPDVVERYAAAHLYGSSPVPDVLERYAATHPRGADTVVAGPARRGIDYFRDAPTVSSPTTRSGLDWADFGIGAGAMLGLTVLLAALGVGAIAMRHRHGRLETS
jgi:hypothetical protein